ERYSIDWSGKLLGSLHLASIFPAHSAHPFTLAVPFDANLDGNLTDRPATAAGLVFVDGHHAQRIVQVAPTTSFFVVGQNGAVGRNTARGGAYVKIDTAPTRNIAFSDSRRLVLRFEAFNVLNRANFGLPRHTIGAPGFGSATETIGTARLLQFAIKYEF